MSLVTSKAGASVYPGLILYRCVLWLALPFVILRLWWRGRRDPTYRPRWRERFGELPEIYTANDVIVVQGGGHVSDETL